MITNNPARLGTPDEDGEQNWLIWQASPTDGRHNEPHRVGVQDGFALERQSRCVTIAGHSRHARSADMDALAPI
jgi:hypothetical protein